MADRVSTLELLQRVLDESGSEDGPGVPISRQLTSDIKDLIDEAARSSLTPERVTAAVQQTDRLFTAITNLAAPPMEPVRKRFGQKNWYVCIYCDAQEVRQPLQHRAGCVWKELKDAWGAFPGNPTEESR